MTEETLLEAAAAARATVQEQGATEPATSRLQEGESVTPPEATLTLRDALALQRADAKRMRRRMRNLG